MGSSIFAYDVLNQRCPARLFFERLADKWVLLILTVLVEQPTHFNGLKNQIEGISPKVLTQKLKMLQRDGFVTRQLLDTAPIRVQYQLSDLGHNVAQTALNLKDWAESHIEQVLSAQAIYDQITSNDDVNCNVQRCT